MKKRTVLLLSLLIALTLTSYTKASPYTYYSVKEGDSLYKISKKFGVTIDYLIYMNNLVSTDIYPGTTLITSSSDASPVKITVNGQLMDTDGFIQNDRTLVPIRFISEMAGAEVDWLPTEKNAVVIFNGKVILLKSDSKDVYVNGVHQTIDVPAMNIGGRIFVPLRFIAENKQIAVKWDGDQKTVHLTVNKDTQPVPYTEEDLYWMSRIIDSESQGQPLYGQLAVGSVVMNRVASKDFPDTVKGVIFQPKQFTPVSNRTIYNTPHKHSITVAKMVLNGYMAEKNALYFLNPDKSTSFWIVKNRKLVASIGDHDFYR